MKSVLTISHTNFTIDLLNELKQIILDFEIINSNLTSIV